MVDVEGRGVSLLVTRGCCYGVDEAPTKLWSGTMAAAKPQARAFTATSNVSPTQNFDAVVIELSLSSLESSYIHKRHCDLGIAFGGNCGCGRQVSLPRSGLHPELQDANAPSHFKHTACVTRLLPGQNTRIRTYESHTYQDPR